MDPDATRPAPPRTRAPRLSADRIAAARSRIEPALLDTPLRSSAPLSDALGCELLLKDEGAGPLGCFKGRGADLFVAAWLARPGTSGRGLVCASAGNFGLALADAGQRRGAAVTVFVAEGASPIKIARIRERGATVVEGGADFEEAKQAAEARAAATGAVLVEDGAEPEIAEGAGTMAAELDAAGPLDAILVPVGNGALAAGIGTWARARWPGTRVIGVVSAGAPVMLDCWVRGLDAVGPAAAADTIADGIAVRIPVPAAVDDLAWVIDEMVAVGDDGLLAAMRQLHALAGIAVEPSAAAGLAAIAAHRDRFAGRRVATVLTGGNLTDEQRAAWLAPA